MTLSSLLRTKFSTSSQLRSKSLALICLATTIRLATHSSAAAIAPSTSMSSVSIRPSDTASRVAHLRMVTPMRTSDGLMMSQFGSELLTRLIRSHFTLVIRSAACLVIPIDTLLDDTLPRSRVLISENSAAHCLAIGSKPKRISVPSESSSMTASLVIVRGSPIPHMNRAKNPDLNISRLRVLVISCGVPIRCITN